MRSRLTDNTYRERKQVLSANGVNGSVPMEVQDIYLADTTLPSRTGKLVGENWRRYPYLGTALDLIRKGTYSIMTRSLVLLDLTPKVELEAFERIDRQANPFRLSLEQALLFLYCFIDNDAEVVFPLLSNLLAFGESSIPEKDAGLLLPDILRKVEKKQAGRPCRWKTVSAWRCSARWPTRLKAGKSEPIPAAGAP